MVNDLSANPVRLHSEPLPRAADPETGDAQLLRGALVGSLSTGIRRMPARASAPAALSLGDRLSAIGPGGPPNPGVLAALPLGGRQSGPKPTTAAGVIPGHLAAVVDQTAGAR